MNLSEVTTNGAADKSITGLHDAKVGDIIQIGIQGMPQKLVTKIARVVSSNRLQDEEGNVFGRDGIIFRRKGYQLAGSTGKIVSARQVTQKELDNAHDKQRRKYLKGYDWDKLDDERLTKVLNLLRVDFGDIQKRKPYE